MTNEEFLKDICSNHTDKSKWNKSELLHILDKYQALQLQKGGVNDSFVIEVAKNNRLFFIGEIYELTWKKENALKFKSIEEAENEIKNNRFLELITKNNYKVINYIDAVSH